MMNGAGIQEPALAAVPRAVLEDYVLDQIKQFAVVFAQELLPNITQQQLDLAFSRALYTMSAQNAAGQQAQLELRFAHPCRYMGCVNRDCLLCKNNPHKTCEPDDNFDEAYADTQVLKARCDAEICVELINKTTGEIYPAPGVEVQLCVIDGDAFNSNAPDPLATVVTLLHSDNNTPLLQTQSANRAQISGTVLVSLQSGRAKLPDVFIADKNDTFHFNNGAQTGRFRLMALALRRDEMGALVTVDHVAPAVSNAFVVKTQRALNDYRKSAFPHYKDELTRLRYIGVVSANRLKDAKACLGPDVPLSCVDNVESLKKLVEYADTNRKVEKQLIEMLNMRGRHRHKWDFLRSVLAERVVYDDTNMRLWAAPDGSGRGLLYYAKQAQVVLDRPAGIVQRVHGNDGSSRLQVMTVSDLQSPQLSGLITQAEQAWQQKNHPGWSVLQEPIEWVSSWSANAAPGVTHAGAGGPPIMRASTAPQLHSGGPPSVEELAAAALAAASAAAGIGRGGAYPAVARGELGGQMPAQMAGAHAYPDIAAGMGGVEHFGVDAAAQQQQQGSQSSQPGHPAGLRQGSDTTMSSLSGGPPPEQRQADGPHHPDPGSAFMQQEFDAETEAALSTPYELRHASDTSDANNVPPPEELGNAARPKRAHVLVGSGSSGGAPTGQRGIYHTESRGRHMPMARPAHSGDVDISHAGGRAPGPQPDTIPELPLPLELPSLTPDVVGDLMQLTRSETPTGAVAGGAAAAAQQRGGGQAEAGRDAEEGGLMNTFSSLNLNPSLLPPAGNSLYGALLPPGGDLSSLGLGLGLPAGGSSGARRAVGRHLGETDSFRRIIGDCGLGSPKGSGGMVDKFLVEPNGGGGAGAAPGAGAAADAPAGAEQRPQQPKSRLVQASS